MYQDKTLTCSDCGSEFTFTASEQEFYAEKGFANEPKRCPECRTARRQNTGGRSSSGPREMHTAICAECGVETQVPFRPKSDRPVYCRDCYNQKNR